jgi:hypothetical protein
MKFTKKSNALCPNLMILKKIIYVFHQKLSPKLKPLALDRGKNNNSTSSTFNKCNSLTAKLMTLNFWEELVHLSN